MIEARNWFAIPRPFTLTAENRQFLHARGVTEAGIKYIERCLADGSSRPVRQNRVSVVVRLPNPTTGLMDACESDGEFAFAESRLSHPGTRLLMGQPEALQLSYSTEAGRKKTYSRHFDFLLLSEDFTGLVEHKTEADLLSLSARDPACWQQSEDGWHCPPGEAAAQRLGLQFSVVTAADVNHIRLANFRLLEDYFDPRTPALTELELTALAEVFRESPYRSLEELQLDSRVNIDTLMTAIAQGQLLCDLSTTRLDQPMEFPVFLENCYLEAYLATRPGPSTAARTLDSVSLQEGSRIVWSSTAFTAIAVDAEKALLASDDGGRIQELLVDEILRLRDAGSLSIHSMTAMTDARAQALELIANASASSRAAMLRRYPIVQAALAKKPLPEAIPARTLAYWVAQFREAETLYGLGIAGLLRDQSGNFSARFPEATYQCFKRIKKKWWDGIEGKTFTAFYSAFKTACDEEGLPCPSSKTARKWLDEADAEEERVKNRQGSAEAYKFQPFHFWLDYQTPRHGLYPWHIVHIDHTKIDVQVRLPNGLTRSRRAWLTLAIDAFSRRVVSVLLMWDPPSHRTCMLVIRQMVKRWGRVPNTIVVDGGSEFRSTNFELLLATMKIKKKTRPGSKPRAGSVIERLFGLTDIEFLHNLRGNTQATKRDVRTVTAESDPKAHSVWSLPGLQVAAQHYFYVAYDGNEHGGVGMKPCEAYAQGIALWGERKHVRWAFNEGLEILTMPSPPRGKAKVVPGRGVKINYQYFWSPVFRDGKVERTSVPVKYDPYDGSRAWAHVNGKWHRLMSQHAALYAGLSERATQILTDRILDAARKGGKRLSANAKSIADMLRKVDKSEEFLAQVGQDHDQVAILQLIFGTSGVTGTTSMRPDAVQRPSEQPARPASSRRDESTSDSLSTHAKPTPANPTKALVVLEDLA